jgi:preprotein translocase SecE subunit
MWVSMDILMFLLKIAGIALGVGTLYLLIRYRKEIIKFVEEVLAELQKVSWTPRKDLINATWIVLISAICLGLFITTTDLLISRGMQAIIR